MALRPIMRPKPIDTVSVLIGGALRLRPGRNRSLVTIGDRLRDTPSHQGTQSPTSNQAGVDDCNEEVPSHLDFYRSIYLHQK